MKVLLLRTWLTNIGNGFIEHGSEVCIRRAFPDAEIIEVSGFPNYVSHYMAQGFKNQLFRLFGYDVFKRSTYAPAQRTAINVAEFINDADVAILPGCILDTSLAMYMPTLKKIRKNNIPLIFLGAGGGDYTTVAQESVSKFIDELKPIALLARDPVAHALYSKHFNSSYEGIDCGFFINDYYTPPRPKEPFIAATFDFSEEPEIASGHPILRAYHEPFNYANMHQSIISRTSSRLAATVSKRNLSKVFKKQNILISDSVKDYLFLYANAKEVHSDRVHACVAALSYGNKARLYSNTPRAALFDKLLIKDVTKNLVSLSRDKLKEEKQKQITALEEAVKESF